MRVALRFLAVLCPVIALAVFGSLKMMESLESRWMAGDLSRRSLLISESVHDYLVDNLRRKRVPAIHRLLNRISKDERLLGAALCGPSGELITRSDSLPSELVCSDPWLTARQEGGAFMELGALRVHSAIFPVKRKDQVLGYLLVIHDTSYMTNRQKTTRTYVVVLLSALSVFFFFLTLAVYRWTRSESVNRLKSVFKGLLVGDDERVGESLTRSGFSPLVQDLSRVMRELRHAKDMVKEAETGLAWTPSRLRTEVQKVFGDTPLCVIANREPYVHNRNGSKVEVLLPASGLVTAVEPIVRACSGLWIAHGSGSADRETADPSGKLLVPPGNPEYGLKRVWLTKAEEQGYYYGFSNEGLWPLCHIAHTRPSFSSQDYDAYRKVNEKFARAFLDEHRESDPVALIQDYHFALLPQMIRSKRPNATLSLFWHIPWPNPEAFGICPWKKELLTGMLGADLIGFHTQFHCNNFLDTVDRFLEARVDRENFSVTIQGHVCYVKPFSISIEWPPRYDLPTQDFASEREALLSELNLPPGIRVGVGVDRVDYTKGLIERLRSVERLLDLHPELVGKFVFIQIGAPSRTHIKRYQDLNAEIQEVA
ncbi:MAG TPA: trehalose-6-phosphate synthase, partial [Bdellovibrionota bacterium]|nr:trehalose-6-phosphate synthase [Bdellovibrionota bacterium]